MAAEGTPYKVLIIGCGAIAGGYDVQDPSGDKVLTHAKAYNEHPGFQLTACLDVEPERSAEFAEAWGILHSYSDLATACAEHEFDVVSICSSTASHEQYLRALLEYPTAMVLCEKPLVDDLAAAGDIVEKYKNAGRMLAVNYIRRWTPELRELAGQVKAGAYGKLLRGIGCYNKGLLNNGSHMIDLLHMMMGEMEIVSAGKVSYDFWENDPTVDAILKFKGGAEIFLIGGDVGHYHYFDLRLMMEKAVISIENHSKHICINRATESCLLSEDEIVMTSHERGMYHVVDNLYECLQGRAGIFCTAEQALKALKLCQDIKVAAGINNGRNCPSAGV